MPRPKQPDHKIPFSTRISPRTLEQLDKLVQTGSYPNRTAALETAVAQLAENEEDVLERRRRAVRETAGVFPLGMTTERMREDQSEYYDWLADRLMGRS